MSMYLSTLLIDAGDNPDRPRPGRVWLRNRYRIHQRLCMGFPSPIRRRGDATFQQPFRPADFGEGHVHVARQEETGFLFRVDPVPGGRAVILVQSAVAPDWDYAFHNAGFLPAGPAQVREFAPAFVAGQELRFRLEVNPTKKVDTKSGSDGKRRNGRRVPVAVEAFPEWLDARAADGGFAVEHDATTVQPGFAYFSKTRKAGGTRLRSARFDGLIRVLDPERFEASLVGGIGPAKGFGFGLLSVSS